MVREIEDIIELLEETRDRISTQITLDEEEYYSKFICRDLDKYRNTFGKDDVKLVEELDLLIGELDAVI